MLPLVPFVVFVFPNNNWFVLPVFWCCQILVWILSFTASKKTFSIWYEEVFLYGVNFLAEMFAETSNGLWFGKRWIPFFKLWWGFCIKYFFPYTCYLLLIIYLKGDLERPYEDYYFGWQLVGSLIPISGLVIVLYGIFDGSRSN